jgi:hypothetical protein
LTATTPPGALPGGSYLKETTMQEPTSEQVAECDRKLQARLAKLAKGDTNGHQRRTT